jgi:hypothetical protein
MKNLPQTTKGGVLTAESGQARKWSVSGLASGLMLATVILLGTAGTKPLHAADAASGTGIGFILGSPTGLSLKLPQGRANAWQFAFGWDLDGPDGGRWNDPPNDDPRFYVGGDYLWYNYNLIHVNKGRLPLYYGPGAFVSISNNTHAGIRGVIGLEYQFANAPFDIFLEVGPGITIIPDTHGAVFAGLGGRFFF